MGEHLGIVCSCTKPEANDAGLYGLSSHIPLPAHQTRHHPPEVQMLDMICQVDPLAKYLRRPGKGVFILNDGHSPLFPIPM